VIPKSKAAAAGAVVVVAQGMGPATRSTAVADESQVSPAAQEPPAGSVTPSEGLTSAGCEVPGTAGRGTR